MCSSERASGGRAGARRLLVAAALLTGAALGGPVAASDDARPPLDITVREHRGVYSVVARFHVPQASGVAHAVLTDYERIPRFMPPVMTSLVRERAAGRAIVEQEAVSRLMLFSKRIHLILEIDEQPDVLRFRDRCGRSFARYEGLWRLSERNGTTRIQYELIAEPRFGVPGFVLKRVLQRDSANMIAQLQQEIAARSTPSPRPFGH